MATTGNSNSILVLIDLSGTLHIGNNPTKGAVDALERLRSNPRVRTKFVTNTTKESRRYLRERLNTIGFGGGGKIEEGEIFTSLSATRRFLETRGSKRPLLMLEDAALEDFRGIPYVLPGYTKDDDVSAPPVDAVVVGLAPSRFDYASMNEAFQLLLGHNRADLIAVHKARYYKSEDGQLSLAPGPFVEALEYASDRKAIVVGKPERQFFLDAIRELEKDGGQQQPRGGENLSNYCVMIGDDARDDVGGAQAASMRGILVKTGKYRPGDEGKIDPAPWAVVENFSEAVVKVEEWIAQL